jgi:TonB family protein
MSFVCYTTLLAAVLSAVSGMCLSAKADEIVPSTAATCPYRPTHATPLAMNSEDYPLLSIAQAEQGRVTLAFVIQLDGSITDVKVAKSSGFARLDGAAVDVATKRWHFDPVVVDGKPVSCRYGVSVAWTIEWTAEQLAQSGFIIRRLGASDYPTGSAARHETGQTLVFAIVDPGGKIAQAYATQSSGFPIWIRRRSNT